MISIQSDSHIRDDVPFVQRSLVAVNVELRLLPLLQRHVVASSKTHVVLSGTDYLVLRVVKELIPVSKPPSNSGNHEKYGEHVSRKSHGLIDDSGVEIDVRIKLPLDEVGITQSYLFQFDRNFNEFFLSGNLKNLIGYLFDELSSRIIVFIDAVTESIEQSFFLLHVIDKLGNVLFLANRLQHPKNCLIGTSVFGTVKSSSCTCDRGVDVHS